MRMVGSSLLGLWFHPLPLTSSRTLLSNFASVSDCQWRHFLSNFFQKVLFSNHTNHVERRQQGTEAGFPPEFDPEPSHHQTKSNTIDVRAHHQNAGPVRRDQVLLSREGTRLHHARGRGGGYLCSHFRHRGRVHTLARGQGEVPAVSDSAEIRETSSRARTHR